MPETLLIVGASVRAAAQSAVRADFQVSAVDLFGDLDLRAIAPVWQVSSAEYPAGLIAAAAQAPSGPWMYTGGLENYPLVVAEISKSRELLGCDVQWLQMLRHPFGFSRQLSLWGFPTTTLDRVGAMPTAGKWLLKPTKSSGGLHLKLFTQPPYPTAPPDAFWSELVEGVSQSALYCFAGGQCGLLSVTEQLTGVRWSGAPRFAYAGNIGPVELADGVYEQYLRLGEKLANCHLLRGLAGVDTILGEDGRIYPLEINPRYTASIEILERALPIQPIAWHVAACRHQELPDFNWEPTGSCAAHGKVIIYAMEETAISAGFVDWCLECNQQNSDWPTFADLPHPGTTIDRGQPILTAFANGGCVESVRMNLRQQANTVYTRLNR